MVSFSNVKINIGLYVTGKRPDGYHSIESLFFPIDLKDAVELIPTSEYNELVILENEIPGAPEQNSCWQALELMQQHFEINKYKIILQKKSPIGAGLGGGSSNAATVIKMINELEQLHLTVAEMKQLALQLGSDNAFFIENKPKFVTGRGELFEPCMLNLSQCQVVLINPNIYQSTQQAYEHIKSKPAPIDLRHIERAHLMNQSVVVQNDFQPLFLAEHKQCKEILNVLNQNGAFYSSLTGTGATFYGLFAPHKEVPQAIEDFAVKNNYFYYKTTFLD